MSEVAVIGAGRMGGPMVGRLVQAGHHVRVLIRNPEVAAHVRESGAIAADDISDVITASTDIAIIVVLTDDQVREVCLDGSLLDLLPAGAVVVVHTTGSPTTSAQIAERATSRGIGVVDAAVSGGPHDIAAGRLTVFTGGTDGAADTARHCLAAYAEPIIDVGALGNGQRVKLVNNAMFAAQIGLVRAGVDLAARLGIDESVLLSALPHASSRSNALDGIARRGSVDGFADAVREFVGKDVEVVRSVSAELGGDLGPLEPLIGQALPGLR